MCGLFALLICFITFELSKYTGGWMSFIVGFLIILLANHFTEKYRQTFWNAVIWMGVPGLLGMGLGNLYDFNLEQTLLVTSIVVFILQALSHVIISQFERWRLE